MIIRDIFHERISDPIRSVTISGKSVLIRDNKLVRIIRSAPIRVIVKAENPLRNNPWVFASTDIRSAPHREFLKKKNPLRGSDFNPYISLIFALVYIQDAAAVLLYITAGGTIKAVAAVLLHCYCRC